jgi:putative ABC transport system permease protein
MSLPYTPVEGLFILAAVSSLLVVVVILSYLKKLDVGKEFSYAMLKGGSQLAVIAVILTVLFQLETWYIYIWILLGAMILIAGYTSAKRATNMPAAHQVTTPAILTGASTALIVLAITRAMPMQPQFIIPLAGMAFGNSMAICSLSMERVIREVQMNRTAIESMLSLGATSNQALEPYTRISVRAALIPTIDSLKTLGVIFIPGAMSGLLIAGTDPLLAAEYQIIVYLMIVGGGIISTLVATTLARKKLFTEYDQLAEWTVH